MKKGTVSAKSGRVLRLKKENLHQLDKDHSRHVLGGSIGPESVCLCYKPND